jgi:predicted GNAT superfamily acetyltransferase
MDNIMDLNAEFLRLEQNEKLVVRRADVDDIDGIMDVACSVGNSSKIHTAGFLMDDYTINYNHFWRKFTRLIIELKHFYIIEGTNILGFLIAYDKEKWLEHNPGWIESISWHPQFDLQHIDNFILIDKTAVSMGLTGRGLGSMLYTSLAQDLTAAGIHDIFAETIISPKPNFASLEFRMKQNYTLAGVRYEEYKDTVYTDLVYHKQI